MEQAARKSSHDYAAGYGVGATQLDDNWQVRLSYMLSDGTGSFDRYITATQARELAAALIRAADHYDAETARLTQQVAA